MEVNGNNSPSMTSFQSFELLLCLKIVLNFKFFTVEDLQLYRTGIGLFFFLLVFPRCAFRLNKRVDRAIYRSCRNSRIQISNSRYAGWMWPNTFLRVHTHAFLAGLNTEVTFCTEQLDHNSSSSLIPILMKRTFCKIVKYWFINICSAIIMAVCY